MTGIRSQSIEFRSGDARISSLLPVLTDGVTARGRGRNHPWRSLRRGAGAFARGF